MTTTDVSELLAEAVLGVPPSLGEAVEHLGRALAPAELSLVVLGTDGALAAAPQGMKGAALVDAAARLAATLGSEGGLLPGQHEALREGDLAHHGVLLVPARGGGELMGTVLWAGRHLDARLAELLAKATRHLERIMALERAQPAHGVVVREQLAALGELAGVLAHEVRNPLAVIFNSLSALRRLLQPSGDTDMLLSMVSEEAERLDRLVGDLLDFVRPFEPKLRWVAVSSVVSSAVEAAARAVPKAAVRLVTELDATCPSVVADAELLRRALTTLVINALQASPPGAAVLLRSGPDRDERGAWLRLSVVDEGPGVSAAAAAALFEPAPTGKVTGAGLGLAVVKRVVEAHRGRVEVRPNAGKGSTFSLWLPTGTERERLLTPPQVVAAPGPR